MKNTKGTIRKTSAEASAPKNTKVSKAAAPVSEITVIQVQARDISFNPKNHRQLYSESALQDFAHELALHGIISPITIRTVKGKYELVVGERRLRAALLAGIKKLPAIVREYNDAEVNEIQLAENLQREDPHPLHIALAIKIMRDAGLSIDEISSRLGKSATFVYARLKLLTLIKDFQEVFLSGKISTNDAFQIASLSEEAQEDFFSEYFSNWQSNSYLPAKNLESELKKYRCNLNNATFDTEDSELLPDAGACGNCPFNSAYLQTLFPDLSKERQCMNSGCFIRKSDEGFRLKVVKSVEEFQPAFFIIRPYTSDRITSMLAGFEGIMTIKSDEITCLEEPEMPNRDDYTNENEEEYDDEDDVFENGDKQYGNAMEEYQQAHAEFLEEIESGGYQKGLEVRENAIERQYFIVGKRTTPVKQTAKAVQEAIKNKTVTPEMLESEIERIDDREVRAKELDIRKIRTDIYDKYGQHVTEQGANLPVTAEDSLSVRLLVYERLDFHRRLVIDELLETKMGYTEIAPEAYLHMALGMLTDAEFCYMVRLALTCTMSSQYLQNSPAYFLRSAAIASGVDVAHIERAQQEVAEARVDRVATRTHELNRLSERLKRKRNAQ
ncbi:ParB/RepB/Spo0J family partition protein [Chitinophaga pollutisoli]|uniref:ParB/RepB/Spo0J family partition protein n=1 Tax=Chitinophaga pollutisoli TaxID=3133966 RepID=A0ABZ2YMU8_9BACT|nr:ParB/RepB/Spo0J family partition protein [Chitinophaga rhizosphaerae]